MIFGARRLVFISTRATLPNQAIKFMSTQVRSTAASGSSVYESKRAVDEYLLFHYGSPQLLMPYSFGPTDALHFAERVAELAVSRHGGSGNAHLRALDVGCAVGGLSFALARYVPKVVGIDYSQHFVDAANNMKSSGSMEFKVLKQGTIFESAVASIPQDIDRNRAEFLKGDACELNPSLGDFDIIVASNLLCRLPNPRKFLEDVSKFLRPGGVLVMVSPYSWLEEYTSVDQWLGARSGGEDSWSVVQNILKGQQLKLEYEEQIPFLIREHERKFQYGVSHGSVWRK